MEHKNQTESRHRGIYVFLFLRKSQTDFEEFGDIAQQQQHKRRVNNKTLVFWSSIFLFSSDEAKEKWNEFLPKSLATQFIRINSVVVAHNIENVLYVVGVCRACDVRADVPVLIRVLYAKG